MRLRVIWLWGLIALFLTGTTCSLSQLVSELSASGQSSGVAPDFTVTTLQGDEFTLSEQRGKIVVINFWASWAGPSRIQAPILESVWQKYRDNDVVVIGLAYVDTERGAREFIAEFGLTYPNGMDIGTTIAGAYGIQGVPETIIVDRDGNIAHLRYGIVAEDELSALLDGLMENNGTNDQRPTTNDQ